MNKEFAKKLIILGNKNKKSIFAFSTVKLGVVKPTIKNTLYQSVLPPMDSVSL